MIKLFFKNSFIVMYYINNSLLLVKLDYNYIKSVIIKF